jgi:hypothetical protein
MDVSVIAKGTVAVGVAFAAVQILNALRQIAAASPSVLPADLNTSDLAAVRGAAEKLTGGDATQARLRSLLGALAGGASRGDIVQLAGLQSSRADSQARGALFFTVLLLLTGMMPGVDAMFGKIAVLGLGLAGLMYFLQVSALAKVDAAVEAALLSRLPSLVEGTQLTAAALAEKLGGAIEAAFKNYVPQPEKLAAATTSAVEASIKNTAVALDGVTKKLAETHEAFAVKIAGLQKEAAAAAEAAQKKQAELNESLAAKLAGFQKETVAAAEASQKKQLEASDALAAKWASSQKETVLNLDAAKKAMDGVAAQLQSNLSGASDKWQAAMQAHGQQVTQANQLLAAQLEKIQALGKEIEKVLHVQQTVDNTIKSVTTTEDFKNTLATLKTHLEKSDNLLREVTKPRTIRLVESENA